MKPKTQSHWGRTVYIACLVIFCLMSKPAWWGVLLTVLPLRFGENS